MELTNGALSLLGVRRHGKAVVEALQFRPRSASIEERELHLHWMEDGQHFRSVFHDFARATDAWNDLQNVCRVPTNSVFGLRINETELFMVRRAFFSSNTDPSGGAFSADADLLGPLLYPKLYDLVHKTQVCTGQSTERGVQWTYRLQLHLPLNNGEVSRAYDVYHTIADNPVLDGTQETWLKASGCSPAHAAMAAGILTHTIYTTLGRRTMIFPLLGKIPHTTSAAPAGPCLMGEHRLLIGIDFLCPTITTHPSGILALYDDNLCHEVVAGVPFSHPRSLHEFVTPSIKEPTRG